MGSGRATGIRPYLHYFGQCLSENENRRSRASPLRLPLAVQQSFQQALRPDGTIRKTLTAQGDGKVADLREKAIATGV